MASRATTQLRIGRIASMMLAAFIGSSICTAFAQPDQTPVVAPAESESDSERAMEEFKNVWNESRDWSPPVGFVYEFRRLMYSTQSPAEIRRRLAEIAPFPDHPERGDLERDLSRAEGGPDVNSIIIWMKSGDEFRFSQTVASAAGGVIEWDAVQSRRTRWRLSDDNSSEGKLFIYDPSGPEQPGSTLVGAADSIQQHLRDVLTGGLAAPRVGFEPISAEFTASGLVGVARNDEYETRFTFERWDDGRLRLVETDSRRVDSSERTGSRRAEWQSDPTLTAVARRVEQRVASGAVRFAIEFVSVRPLRDGEFESVVGIPVADGRDVLRGPHDFTTIWDYRAGVGTISTRVDGAIEQMPIPPELMAPINRSAWRWVGWIVAGVLVSLLIALKARARRRSVGSRALHARG